MVTTICGGARTFPFFPRHAANAREAERDLNASTRWAQSEGLPVKAREEPHGSSRLSHPLHRYITYFVWYALFKL